MIYFIRAGLSGPIKIGYSSSEKKVQVRLATLQTGSWRKLYLLATIPGTVQVERMLHKKFQAYRLEGEWFQSCQALINFIEHGLSFKGLFSDEVISKIKSLINDDQCNINILKNLPLPELIKEIEKNYIILALNHTKQNKLRAAKLLGVSRSTLYQKLIEISFDK